MISGEMNSESCEKKQKRKGRKKRKIISENHNNVSSRSSSLSCTKLRPSFYSRPRVLGRRHTRREERREKNVNMREQVIDLHVVLQQYFQIKREISCVRAKESKIIVSYGLLEFRLLLPYP